MSQIHRIVVLCSLQLVLTGVIFSLANAQVPDKITPPNSVPRLSQHRPSRKMKSGSARMR